MPALPTLSPSKLWGALAVLAVASVALVPAARGVSATTYTFADVPPANPFFSYIEQAASRGLMSGYPCGGPGEPCDSDNRPYFRPYVDVTRAQVAKTDSDSAGFSDTPPPGTQTFADVSSFNPFYTYIERLAARGLMSGFTCGGPGEPCDPSNRPYFRPFNDATRGQLAKTVSNTAGFSDTPPPGTQSFADVSSFNPFYLYIERLAARGVMSGFSCGGPGEPCDPSNRPYFRPFNYSTRAILAKTVVLAFPVPTAVRSVTVSADRTGTGVAVHWRTRSEFSTLGYRVYRETAGRKVRLGWTAVSARSSHSYTFIDRHAPRGIALWYWIQAVELDGSSAWYGPARAIR